MSLVGLTRVRSAIAFGVNCHFVRHLADRLHSFERAKSSLSHSSFSLPEPRSDTVLLLRSSLVLPWGPCLPGWCNRAHGHNAVKCLGLPMGVVRLFSLLAADPSETFTEKAQGRQLKIRNGMRKTEFCCTIFVFCCTIFAGGRAQAPRPPPRYPEVEGLLQDTSNDLATAGFDSGDDLTMRVG